jgi:hypothetical protein
MGLTQSQIKKNEKYAKSSPFSDTFDPKTKIYKKKSVSR